ncbi:MAG: hypothetical protein D3925_01095 [Candidatus Electrothrix sp. AR5]|nr:hypothetical protein [Candidatus Electrothrix sp. AR5]
MNTTRCYYSKKSMARKTGESIIKMLHNKYKCVRDKKVPFPQEHSNFSNCIIGNAPPKSGTYLLNSIFNYLDNWKNIGIHILNTHYIDFGNYDVDVDTRRVYRSATENVKKLKNGQLIAAHLPWSKKLDEILSEQWEGHSLKHVLMIRDPRDTAVSRMRYTTYAKNFVHDQETRAVRKFMLEEFKNDDERLAYVLQEHLARGDFALYLNWFKHSNTYLVRFEKLYPELCALNVDGFGPTFKGLFKYLEVDIENHDPVLLKERVLGKSLTSSGLKEKIAQYRKVFKKQHYALINNAEVKENIERFGYKY